MPRRLDPKKGLPGLFAPGRPKATEMAFLVEAPRAEVTAAAVAAPEPRRPRKTRAKRAQEAPIATPTVVAPIPAPVAAPAPAPIPDYIRLAPAFRAVPALPPQPEPLRIAEIPSMLSCMASWVRSMITR